MTTDGHTQATPGVDRRITRADLEAKFDQLRGTTSVPERTRSVGLAALVAAGVVVLIGVYLLGRRRGRRRRTIVEVRRT